LFQRKRKDALKKRATDHNDSHLSSTFNQKRLFVGNSFKNFFGSTSFARKSIGQMTFGQHVNGNVSWSKCQEPAILLPIVGMGAS
jgi:hypothetical protein